MFLNINNGDSIWFVNDSLADTTFVIQEGNAKIIEQNGYVHLLDSTNIDQYDSLINLGYYRITRIDHDYAGICRNFVGIDFDSTIIRKQHFSYDTTIETMFMGGHDYCGLFYLDKSYIDENELHFYKYQIKIENAQNNQYYILMRAWECIYHKNGNYYTNTLIAYYAKRFANISYINGLEFIDFSFIEEGDTTLTMKATFSNDSIYQYSVPFDNTNYYLTQILDYINPYNPNLVSSYDGYIKNNYLRYYPDIENPDSSWFVVAHPRLLYACVDTTFNITVKDGKRDLFPVENARVTISDGGRILYEGITDYLGVCTVTDFYYPEIADLTIEVNKEEEIYTTYTGIIQVDEKYVLEYPEDMKVIDYENVQVILKMWDDFTWDTVLTKYIPQVLVPVPGAEIIINNDYDINENGITGINGQMDFNYIRTYCTKNVEVEASYGNYHDTGEIAPYMWSYSENATGPNNGNNIIRFNETGELCMTYYQYNPNPDPFVPTRIKRVIEASSTNNGEWWYVYAIDNGQNPSIAITEGTIDGMFYDNGVGYLYDNMELPDPGTVSNGSMWVEPGSMCNNNITNLLHSSGIKYIDEGTPEPYLIHAVFPYDDPENAEVEIIIYPDGEVTELGYLVIPAHNPSICLKNNKFSTNVDPNEPIIAFEDKNSEICWKWYRSNVSEWWPSERKSFSLDQISRNPHIDAYGDNVSLVWEEEIATGTDEYRIYLDNSRFFGDNTETNKKYPKVKRSSYISFVEEDNTVNMWYYKDNYSKKINLTSSEQDISYPDFEVKTRLVRPFLTEHTVYYMFTESAGDIYKIRTGREIFTTNDRIKPLFDMALIDTIEDISNSPLEDYVSASQRPIERLNSTVKGFDENRYYELIVTTTNNNQNTPYVLLIDGQEKEVIYGKDNEITVPVLTENILDNELIVSLDRVKGNPNRTIDIKVYEYDEVELEETAGTANTMLKPFKPSENTTPFSVVNRGIQIGNYQLEVNIPDNSVVKIGIYDIMGREVNIMTKDLIKGKNLINIKKTDKHNNELSKGVYFIRVETDNNNYTGKLINLK